MQSMSEISKRRWQLYLDDMITCGERVIAYTSSLDQAGFIASQIHFDATVRNLELIGEAATQTVQDVFVDEAIREAFEAV